uniref:HMG box domain-containing protein n=1 Tax=Glossina pallidipes TaxID=7398 RepID=A0A1A9ZJN1_GLOPL
MDGKEIDADSFVPKETYGSLESEPKINKITTQHNVENRRKNTHKVYKADDDVKFRERASPSASCAQEAIYKNSTARTSFFVFLHEYRRKLKKNKVRIRQTELCRVAGMKWWRLTDSEKKPYVIWAENNRQQLRYTSKRKAEDTKRNEKRATSSPRSQKEI